MLRSVWYQPGSTQTSYHPRWASCRWCSLNRRQSTTLWYISSCRPVSAQRCLTFCKVAARDARKTMVRPRMQTAAQNPTQTILGCSLRRKFYQCRRKRNISKPTDRSSGNHRHNTNRSIAFVNATQTTGTQSMRSSWHKHRSSFERQKGWTTSHSYTQLDPFASLAS